LSTILKQPTGLKNSVSILLATKNSPLVSELFELRESGLDSTPISPQEQARMSRVFRTFLEILGPGARLVDITKSHYRKFAEKRIEEGVLPATANREITVIAATVKKASDYFPEIRNFQPAPVFRPKFSKRKRDHFITNEIRDRLLAYLSRPRDAGELEKDFRARVRAGLILKFALLTGLRHGEICLLRKSWLDRSRRMLRVERPKVDQSGEIVLSPLALEVLELASRDLYPGGEFFFSRFGRPHHGFYRLMKEVCEDLKIPYGRKTIDGFVLHDARHTFITSLASSGFDVSTISSFSGHSDAHMVANYTHASRDSRERASEHIARMFGGNGDREKELREIFERVKKGELDFEKFSAAIVKHFSPVF
jgi:integrase